MKFDIISADPPWRFGSRGPRHGKYGKLPYETMSVEEICAIPVEGLAAKDSALFLWFPGSFVEPAVLVCKSWGFRLVRIDKVWKKVTETGKPDATPGPHGMSDAEFIILGTRGAICGRQPRPRNQRTVYSSVVPKIHSRKPHLFYDLIEKRFDSGVSRLEIFATIQRPGWTCVGNAIDGRDVRESLAELALA